MFIDYVTLLLVNTAAGFFMLACYLVRGIEAEHQGSWAVSFSMVGVVSLAGGFLMVLRWPLPGPFNMAFGELSLYFGLLLLGAGLCMAKGFDLKPVGTYGIFAGLAALFIGIRIMELGLTHEPTISGVAFVLSGVAGVAALPLLQLKSSRSLRLLAAAVLLVISVLWARTGYKAYWGHMKDFGKWVPSTAQLAAEK